MDLLDRVGQETRNKNSPDRMGLFQPQRRKAETLLLAWLSASLKAFGGAILGSCRLMALSGHWFDPTLGMSAFWGKGDMVNCLVPDR